MRRKREAKEKEIKRGRRREVMQDWGRLGHAKTAKIRRNLTGLVASESRYGPPRASNPSKAKSAYTNAFIIRRSERKKKGKKKSASFLLSVRGKFPSPNLFATWKQPLPRGNIWRAGGHVLGRRGPAVTWVARCGSPVTCSSAYAIHPPSSPSPFIPSTSKSHDP